MRKSEENTPTSFTIFIVCWILVLSNLPITTQSFDSKSVILFLEMVGSILAGIILIIVLVIWRSEIKNKKDRFDWTPEGIEHDYIRRNNIYNRKEKIKKVIMRNYKQGVLLLSGCLVTVLFYSRQSVPLIGLILIGTVCIYLIYKFCKK